VGAADEQYDSAHSRYQGTVSHDDKNIIIDGKPIRVFNEMDPSNIKWGDAGADFIVESTGKFLTKDGASVSWTLWL
jgi:glyceraldehyde 3-phosphate dehydrogenase